MKKFLLLLLLSTPLFLQAQFTDRYWCFGDSAGIDFSNTSNPIPGQSILRARGSCASICDSLGNLLFYTASPNPVLLITPNNNKQGYILNKNHQIMENGDSIATNQWYQEMIIVPNPGNSQQFYLFTAGVTSPIIGFYYCLIDLSYNGGVGKVIQKNIQLQSFNVSDGLAAIKHGNGKDWWVVMKPMSGSVALDAFYFYLINSSGINGPYIQHIGYPVQYGGFLRLKFTKDGSKLYAMSRGNLFEYYDFNRCSGLLSNVNTIQQSNTSPPYYNYWSFALSGDASKLYATSNYLGANQDTSYLIQYNLKSSQILNSADTLQTFIWPIVPGLVQIGPDNKIYLSCQFDKPDCDFFYLYCDTTRNYVTDNLSVINSPDSLGTACDFQPFSFNLGGHRAYVGLPNNPNYELGPDSGSVCDTLHVGLQDLLGQKSNLFVFYDSPWQTAFINAKGLKGRNYKMQLFNLNGQVVLEESGKLDSEYYTKNAILSSFAEGMYVVRLSTEKEVLTAKFVK